MTNIDRAARTIAESACRELAQPDDIIPYLTQRNLTRAQALAAEGLLMPDLPEPDGWDAGLPLFRACDTEVRPAGYEQRIICTDENGPWETSAADAKAFALALLAAADYAEEES